MKKLFIVAIATCLVSSAAFAGNEGGKKKESCDTKKECCKKDTKDECKKDETKAEKKAARKAKKAASNA